MTQEQATIPGTDTNLSRLCDQFLQAKGAVQTEKEHCADVEQLVIAELHRIKKTSITHRGKVFSVRYKEAKEALSVKAES